MKYLDVDDYINNSSGFWRDLEGNCVPECCGIDAYNFESDYVNKVLQRHNASNILKSLIELNEFLDSSSLDKINSKTLNHIEERTIFKNRILKLIYQINKRKH